MYGATSTCQGGLIQRLSTCRGGSHSSEKYKGIKGYLLLRPKEMSLRRQKAWGKRLVWSCTAEINEKELCHWVQGGRTETWAGGGLKSGIQSPASPETAFPFSPLSQRRKLQKLAYAWKGEEENNCSNLQRICFNFCWKDSKSFIVWTYGSWGEGSKFFHYGSFGILLIIRNKYGLNTRAAMKRDDFLVKLMVVCILVIIEQMDSTCCTSPSTYRWDWNISWIYILFGLTKPGFEFKGQWRN